MTSRIAAALLLLAAAAPSSAVELVTNGGFETGDLTGWTALSSPDVGFVGSFAHSGSFGYLDGTSGSLGVLLQRVAVIAGSTYAYSFWVANDEGTPNVFIAALGQTTLLLSQIDAPGRPYTRYAGTVVAANTDDTLQFQFRHDAGFWALDDVSLTLVSAPGVPEPASWALLVTGFALVGTALRRKPALA